jgi:hypothetical protein
MQCYLGFSLIVATQASESDLHAIVEFCPNSSDIEIMRYERGHLAAVAAHNAERPQPGPHEGWQRLGEILIDEHLISRGQG